MTQDADQLLQVKLEARYVSVKGKLIEESGARSHPMITQECIENRQKRDGPTHHITMINHLEIKQLVPKQENVSNSKYQKLCYRKLKEVLSSIQAEFGPESDWEPPVDLGLGSCWNEEAVTYYRVMFWPMGQKIREYFGLGLTNFHVTVGFNPLDVHQYKGPGSLVCFQPGHSCEAELINRLISYVPYYLDDRRFIKELYLACKRFGYYKQLAILAKTCILIYLKRLFSRFFKTSNTQSAQLKVN